MAMPKLTIPCPAGETMKPNDRYVQKLCDELDNNSREISYRMSAHGGPTDHEARVSLGYITRQQAILKILAARAKKVTG